jgi:hypothetical protein
LATLTVRAEPADTTAFVEPFTLIVGMGGGAGGAGGGGGAGGAGGGGAAIATLIANVADALNGVLFPIARTRTE